MKVQLTRQNIIEEDARAYLIRGLITRPADTFMIDLEHLGILIVDRGAVPNVGSLMLMSSENGFRLQRATKPGIPSKDLWGVVTWHIKRP